MGSATIQRRIAIALASVVLVAAIVVVAVRAGDDEETVALPSPTATATATAAASPGATPKATGSPGASPNATPAATAAQPAATELPEGQVVPPRPGDYRYRETTNGETSDWTLGVADRGSNRYTETLGSDLTNDVVWRPDGKYVERSTFGDPPAGFECDWTPDTRELKLPFANGSEWRFSGKCTPGPGVSIAFKGTSRITGTQRTTIGGQQIDTWAIDTTATMTFTTPDGSGKQSTSSQDRFSADHGLYVRSIEKTEGEDPNGQNVSETTSRELLSLRPS